MSKWFVVANLVLVPANTVGFVLMVQESHPIIASLCAVAVVLGQLHIGFLAYVGAHFD